MRRYIPLAARLRRLSGCHGQCDVSDGMVMLLGAAAWYYRAGHAALSVHTALARPLPGGGAGGSVLDATGYVTARREATVSAQITGTVTAVLIEEGDHVKEGAGL